jgi:hypothetical protein
VQYGVDRKLDEFEQHENHFCFLGREPKKNFVVLEVSVYSGYGLPGTRAIPLGTITIPIDEVFTHFYCSALRLPIWEGKRAIGPPWNGSRRIQKSLYLFNTMR